MCMEAVLPPPTGERPPNPDSEDVVGRGRSEVGELLLLLGIERLLVDPRPLVALVLLDDLFDRPVGAQLAALQVQPALAVAPQVALRVRHEEQRGAAGEELLDAAQALLPE